MSRSDRDEGRRRGSRLVLSPAARVLLFSANPESPAADLRARLEEGPDWEDLYHLALRERAAGPLWARLEPHDGLLPSRFSRALERAAAVERLRQVQLGRKLSEALRVLRRTAVSPLLLKGAALLQTCYSTVEQRPMADLDLLVRPEDGERAWEALREAGWAWNEERYPEEMYARHYHLPPLENGTGTGIGLEVHTGLLVSGHPFAFGPESLRRGAREVEVDGEPALVPRSVNHLVYLCLHFAWSHALGSAGWRTFRDLGVLVETGEVNWDELLREVAGAEAGASAYWTLRLGRDLAGVPIPKGVLEALRPSLPQAVLARLARHYALELFPDRTSCPSVRLRQALWVVGNEWGREGEPSIGRDAVRPWEYSGDFASTEEGEASESGVAKIGRHLGERRGWSDYLRSVVLPGYG